MKQEYEAPNSFWFNILHPYLSYLWLLTDEDNDNYCSFGFADTQVAISTAFLYGTIPFMIMNQTTPASLELTGMVGMFDASGFQISLTKTDYKVSYFSGADCQ